VNDWRVRCIELAMMVRRHEKERMITDKLDMWRRAREILELAKQEDKDRQPELFDIDHGGHA